MRLTFLNGRRRAAVDWLRSAFVLEILDIVGSLQSRLYFNVTCVCESERLHQKTSCNPIGFGLDEMFFWRANSKLHVLCSSCSSFRQERRNSEACDNFLAAITCSTLVKKLLERATGNHLKDCTALSSTISFLFFSFFATSVRVVRSHWTRVSLGCSCHLTLVKESSWAAQEVSADDDEAKKKFWCCPSGALRKTFSTFFRHISWDCKITPRRDSETLQTFSSESR